MSVTAIQVKKAKPADNQYKLFDGKGLFVLIHPNGGKYWRLKYRFDGKHKTLALGVYPDITLADARERRDTARRKIANGVDPSAEKQAQKRARAGADTFEAIAREWLDSQRKTLSADTLRLGRRRLETWVFPAIGNRPIDKIEPPDVLALLRRIEVKGKQETAHRVRQRIGQVMRYAIASGRAKRDPTADLKGALAPAPTTHRAAITEPKKVARLMMAIEGYDGQPATIAALKLLPITFVRPGELRQATWAEFDLDNATWRIPGKRMKMRRDHIVPLSKQAVEVLAWLKPITGHRPFVFESIRPNRPLSENTLNMALRTLGYAGDVMTAHGFRAMASTLLHEQGWPPEVIELQLAHAQRSQVAAAYNRSARLDQRREMMQAWADYLDVLRLGEQTIVAGDGA